MATMNNLTLMNLEGMAADILKTRALRLEEQKQRQMETLIGRRRMGICPRLGRVMPLMDGDNESPGK